MKGNRNQVSQAKRRTGRSRHIAGRLYLAVIAVLAIAGVALFTMGNREGGASPEQVANATGILSAATSFHDFGQVSMRNGKITFRYPVRNDSGTPALVQKIYTSCMCTEATLLVGTERVGPFGMPGMGPPIPTINRVIPAGQQAIVEATFDPNAHGTAGLGRNDRVVSVVLGERRVLQLSFTAYVTP